MRITFFVLTSLACAAACVPPGNATPDAGAAAATPKAPPYRPLNLLTSVFEDHFEREMVDASAARDAAPLLAPADARAHDASVDAAIDLWNREAGARLRRDSGAGQAWPVAPVPVVEESGLGPNWRQAQTSAWKLEKGRLCGQNARNHGVWLTKQIPTNAIIEFDASSDSNEGDLKAELWGDGQSAATTVSYENATSYLTILGGWKNTLHVLARINEHGDDRKVIRVDKTSDDAKQRPVNRGQAYHFKIERSDGMTVKWSVDGIEYLTFRDATPLAGQGHDHFGFNDWEAKVCFDNVKVTPLP